MKKMLTICLLLTIVFTSQAQDGKPTKEQTVQFIKDYYYQNERMNSGVYGWEVNEGSVKYFCDKRVSNIDIQFDGDLNKITMYFESSHKTSMYISKSSKDVWTVFEKHKYVIDLSKIALVYVIVEHSQRFANKDGNKLYGIRLGFEATPGYKMEHFHIENHKSLESLILPFTAEMENKIDIPINFYFTAEEDMDHSIFNKKILKAFDHLRKLCGAPEPISFD